MKVVVRFGQFMLCLVLLAVVSATAGTSAYYTERGVRIIQSTPTYLEVEYRPQVKGFDTVSVAGVSTVLPRIAGAAIDDSQLPGEPTVLTMRLPISVPSETGFRLEQITTQRVESHYISMAPIPSLQYDEVSPLPQYAINQDAYSRPAASAWGTVGYVGMSRLQHIAYINLVAARYDGAAKAVQIPGVIRIKIALLPENPSIRPQTQSRDFYDVTLNAEAAAFWPLLQSISAAKKSTVTGTGGTWLRIGIDNEGVYSIDAAALKSAGLSISPAEVSTIRLYGYGGRELPEKVSDGLNNELVEQPIIVRTSSSGELQSVVFYGASTSGFTYDPAATGKEKFTHFINHYSRRNYYVLTVGGKPGLRADYASIPSGAVINTPKQYTARVFNEEELYNIFNPGSDRRWLGRIANRDIANTYTTVLPNIIKQSGSSVFYRVCVANRTNNLANFNINESGTSLFSIPCGATPSSYYFATISTAQASANTSTLKDDRSVLQFVYTTSNGNQSASGNVDWFEIHYPRELVANGNEVEFFSDPALTGVTEYSINGFSGDILGFDVTDRARPQMLRNQASTGGMFVIRAEHQPQSPSRYFVSSSLKSPASIESADIINLRGAFANTDVIVITNKAFLESAQAYRDYRESQGELTVSVVTTEQIYNEFAAGMPDPTALRDYLAFAFRNWERKPRYAVLWGDGHYDYRNISTSEPVFVPTYQTYTVADGAKSSVESTSTIEDYFARISGNDELVDISMGRIPIRSNEEGIHTVAKIKHYENNSSLDLWRTRITMIADDAWTTENTIVGDGTLHTSQSETLSTNFIPTALYQKKLYLPEYPTENIPGGRRKPRVTEELVNAVNSGTVILNWIGHGNPRVWAHEQIFEKDVTVPLMTNYDKLFFLTAATCDFGRIDDPSRQSGAEELFTSTTGGAIGVFSATRTVYAHLNAEINQTFYSRIFQRQNGTYPRLGDALYMTKLDKKGWNDQKFFLLGDPTMRLHIPPQQIQITSINGIELPVDTLPRVQALSRVTISGNVLGSDDKTVDPSFNGSVIFSLYDSDVNKDVMDIGEAMHRYYVFGGLLNISADSVRNGKFTVTMMVPQDISFSDLKGRLNGYAFSENSAAMGTTRDFVIGGIDTTTVNDGHGPLLSVYVDTYTFRAGDLVRPDPLLLIDLYDETGINATGLGIGHDIEAWIDNAPNSIRLTRDFTISLEDFRRGTVSKQLFGLKPGTHQLRVRAWDVFNNFTEVETYFRVPGGEGEMFVEDVLNYPNPFSTETTIAFRHNQLGNVDATVSIYSVDGKLVRTLQQIVDMRSATILWDGRDEAGSSLPGGVYLYKLQLSANKGLYGEAEGKIVRIR